MRREIRNRKYEDRSITSVRIREIKRMERFICKIKQNATVIGISFSPSVNMCTQDIICIECLYTFPVPATSFTINQSGNKFIGYYSGVRGEPIQCQKP